MTAALPPTTTLDETGLSLGVEQQLPPLPNLACAAVNCWFWSALWRGKTSTERGPHGAHGVWWTASAAHRAHS